MRHWCFEYIDGHLFDNAPISRRLWDFYQRVFNPPVEDWEPTLDDEPFVDFE